MNFCLWITGLPGSGKSTIVKELVRLLSDLRIQVVALNLDDIRKNLTPEPKYTSEERGLVYRSLAIMAQLLVDKGGKSVIIDATGNRKEYREFARRLLPEFAEIYVKCPIEICKVRESGRQVKSIEKNLYQRASRGELSGQLPGISAPYEAPERPEVVVASDVISPKESARMILDYIKSRWKK